MTAPSGIQLVVGLCNPGVKYEKTRHNAGAWLINRWCQAHQVALRAHTGFYGLYAPLMIENVTCHLLMPTTFMNHSGRSVSAIARYYKIASANILVVHDDLDLPPGVAKLKEGGGIGGHNGLRDIVKALGDNSFWRLRIGIGHPGIKEQVIHYVLNKPTQAEYSEIQHAILRSESILPDLLAGQFQQAMQFLHTSKG